MGGQRSLQEQVGVRSSDGVGRGRVLAPQRHTAKPRSAGAVYQRGDAGELAAGVSVIPAPQSQLSTLLRSEWKDQRGPNL